MDSLSPPFSLRGNSSAFVQASCGLWGWCNYHTHLLHNLHRMIPPAGIFQNPRKMQPRRAMLRSNTQASGTVATLTRTFQARTLSLLTAMAPLFFSTSNRVSYTNQFSSLPVAVGMLPSAELPPATFSPADHSIGLVSPARLADRNSSLPALRWRSVVSSQVWTTPSRPMIRIDAAKRHSLLWWIVQP